MAIKKYHGDVYYADYHDAFGRRRRVSLQTTNLRAAQLKYAELLNRRNTLTEQIVKEVTWEGFKDRLFKFMALERAKNTIERTQIAIRYLEEVAKPRYLHEITPATLQGVKEFLLNKGLGKHNINRLMQALKAMMKLSEKWQLMPKQDWTVISKLKTSKGRVVFHTTEEVEKLLEACPSFDWKLVVLLGADAGLRRGEIANLRWNDVEFRHNQLYVAPDKTEHYRYVPMTPELREALEKAKNGARSEFVVNVGKRRTSKYFLTAFYRKIAKKAQVSSFLHKLRHTFASQLVQNGVDLYTVSKLLGHSSIKMTEIYAHLAPDTLQRAVINIPAKNTKALAM